MDDIIRLAEAALKRADALEDTGDLDGAVQAMTKAIQLEPNRMKYRARRGRLLSMQENWQAAIRDFDSVLAVKESAPSILYSRGRARFMSAEFDGALADLERCISLDPDAADAWAIIGDIHRLRRNWEESISAYERARELEPDKRAELDDLILEMKEQIRVLDNGQLEPSLPRTYPSPCRDPEHIRMRDELHEIQQGRRDAVVPYQRKRLQSDDPES